MLASFIITFREILEIAIILGIIAAATRGLAGRTKWIMLGLTGGMMGAGAVALSAESISNAMGGSGQEIFNGSILLLAALMIAWTVVWMQRHAKELAQRMRNVGQAVMTGEKPLYAIALAVSFAMWREGAEIALFLYGIISAGQEPLSRIGLGALTGGLAAACIGWLLYKGLLRIPVKHFFRITGWLLILLACGISAQAAGFFVAGGVLPELGGELWDSSAILSQSSTMGQMLNILLGYTDRPYGIQVAFYVAMMAAILAMSAMHSKSNRYASNR